VRATVVHDESADFRLNRARRDITVVITGPGRVTCYLTAIWNRG
jgi:hypothetical protein